MRLASCSPAFPSICFDPDFVKAKEGLEQGLFGKPVFGGSYTKWYRSQQYYDSGDWRGTWELDGGGALMNQSVHYVDMVQYLVGEVEEVTAYTGCLAMSALRWRILPRRF